MNFSDSVIETIANEIIDNFINNMDVEDSLNSVADDLVEDAIPYVSDGNNDFHCEVAGRITYKLADYLKKGYLYSKMQQS